MCPQPSVSADREVIIREHPPNRRELSPPPTPADRTESTQITGGDPAAAEPLQCTYSACASKDEDRIFTGRGAKPAYKRHMDTHHRPYTCPKPTCGRHVNGFSRRDNLNAHLKTHQKSPVHEHRSGSSPLAGQSGVRKQLQGMSGGERKRLVDILLLCFEMGFEDEDEDHNGEDEDVGESSVVGDEEKE